MVLPSRTCPCPCLNRARAGFYTPPPSSLQQVIVPPQPIATPALQPDICNCARYMQVIVPSTQMSNPTCPDHKLVTELETQIPDSHKFTQMLLPSRTIIVNKARAGPPCLPLAQLTAARYMQCLCSARPVKSRELTKCLSHKAVNMQLPRP